MERGRQGGHRRQPGAGDHELPEVPVDYAFPGSAGGLGVTMLVASERRARMSWAAVVPTKGTLGAFVARGLMASAQHVTQMNKSQTKDLRRGHRPTLHPLWTPGRSRSKNCCDGCGQRHPIVGH